jgi:rhodanese-related sulfurtransferase
MSSPQRVTRAKTGNLSQELAALRARTDQELVDLREHTDTQHEHLRDEIKNVQSDLGSLHFKLAQLADSVKILVASAASQPDLSSPASNQKPGISSNQRSADHPTSRPKKRLESTTYTPEDRPAEYRVWLERAMEYQEYYALSDADATKDLLWASNALVKFRIKDEQQANPQMTFKQLCGALLKRSMPHDMEIVQYRKLQSVTQLERESGDSYVRRFELAMAEYLFYAPSSEATEFYKMFISRMNPKYTDRMREATSSIGLLSQISNSNEKLKQAFSLMRSISLTQIGEKTFADLQKASPMPARSRIPVNQLDAQPTNAKPTNAGSRPHQSGISLGWSCRACQTNDHSWKTCDKALGAAYCYKCKKVGHPTFKHQEATKGSAPDGVDDAPSTSRD